jgi:hypothetical protein
MDAQTIFITVLVVGGFTALLSYISYRQKQSSWVGTVTNKFHEDATSDENGSSAEKFKVTFKTSTGKKVTCDFFEKEFDSYQIGDKAEKKSGEYFPKKIVHEE